ncbi:MAG TPA: cysteine--tRNA ligase [Psychrobacter sp.]|uniref:cysteine--tRNA ligase n=1 Tax=Psychrobacter sp. TaxID=56811 RepID=UPI000EE54E0A|nr:cysteine--tRNA ligase [Psychrobacter sp.]HCR88172.1 cysteine--tRNA ligase [Psychrobacter sp.]
MTTPLADAMSQLAIYDSLNGRKQVFKPLVAGKVGMYVCGMTVYDYCHIGHARMMVAFDMAVRWLKQLGYEVNYVRNITDIDDKIITRAAENGEEIGALTQRFITAMHEDFAALGCLAPDAEPRATDYIDEMQQMIGNLVSNDYAYAGDNGDVYYAVDSFPDYGKLSKRNLDDMQAGSRVDVENDKRNPFDFVLWKAAKPSEPQWASPWGQGRPGWHIECSAMAKRYLGSEFDIHGGGLDLRFPHHENELAQSTAAGEGFARYWVHNGLVTVDGQKMSKSLGNFTLAADVLAKQDPLVVRYALAAAHYRSSLDLSASSYAEADAALQRISTFIARVHRSLPAVPDASRTGQLPTAFSAAMDDDLGVPQALAVLHETVRRGNAAMDAGGDAEAGGAFAEVDAMIRILGLDELASGDGDSGAEASALNALVQVMITQRAQARADKDWTSADRIRDAIAAAGIVLEDTSDGTHWSIDG